MDCHVLINSLLEKLLGDKARKLWMVMRGNKGEFEIFRLERSKLREEIAVLLTRLLTVSMEKNKVKNGG